jgi:hypothetical protein
MEFLTLEYIKDHSRLTFDCDDQLLELYGDSAEEVIASYLNRGKTVTDMIQSLTDEYGKIPARCYQAGQILVDLSYQYRSSVTPGNLSLVPYTGVDILLKPLMKLV